MRNAKHGAKRNLDEWAKAKKEANVHTVELGESVILSHSELVKLVVGDVLYIGAGGTGGRKDI